jgi:hypothetical protein
MQVKTRRPKNRKDRWREIMGKRLEHAMTDISTDDKIFELKKKQRFLAVEETIGGICAKINVCENK